MLTDNWRQYNHGLHIKSICWRRSQWSLATENAWSHFQFKTKGVLALEQTIETIHAMSMTLMTVSSWKSGINQRLNTLYLLYFQVYLQLQCKYTLSSSIDATGTHLKERLVDIALSCQRMIDVCFWHLFCSFFVNKLNFSVWLPTRKVTFYSINIWNNINMLPWIYGAQWYSRYV